jgi:hypothetical protein
MMEDGDPSSSPSFGAIIEEPGGAQFQELVDELLI